MGKSKLHTVIALLCISFLMNKPAYAFWPVLDFKEVMPIGSNVTTSLDSLSQTKSQLTELKKGLKAIGDNIDTLAQFSQDFRNTLNGIADIANESVGIINDNLGTNIDVQKGLTDAIDEVNKVQSGLANSIVDQTQGALGQTNDIIDGATSGIDKAQETGQKVEDFLEKEQGRAQNLTGETGEGIDGNEETPGDTEPSSQSPEDEDVEEEEEEEEIPDAADVMALQEVKEGFATVKDETKKMAEQLNDIMDMAINTLNKSAEESRLAMEKLTQAIRDTEQLDKKDRERLQKKTEELQAWQQRLADRMIAVAESAKEEYNLEYQNKIANGISNYEKSVERYFRGDALREEVISAGEKLKEDVKSMSIAPDKETIAEINQETEKLKSEFIALVAEIRKVERKENNL